jgi:hypothetical protein
VTRALLGGIFGPIAKSETFASGLGDDLELSIEGIGSVRDRIGAPQQLTHTKHPHPSGGSCRLGVHKALTPL